MSDLTAATRDTIFAATNSDLPFADVICSAWGGSVRAYGITSDEKDALDNVTLKRAKKRTPTRFRARLLIASIRDLQGGRLFTAADEDKLAGMATYITDKPFAAALRMCGYTEEEADGYEGN